MRLVLEGIRIAFNALLTNKLRTFLTLLGNIVGIMAVIAVVSLLGGIDNYMRREVASEGSNIFTVYRVNFFEAITDFESFSDAIKYNPKLDRADVTALRQALEGGAQVSGGASRGARVGIYDRHINDIDVRGRDHAYPFVENIRMHAGRHLTALEDRENAQVAVIGWELYTSLIHPRNPIGKLLRIGNRQADAGDSGKNLGYPRIGRRHRRRDGYNAPAAPPAPPRRQRLFYIHQRPVDRHLEVD